MFKKLIFLGSKALGLTVLNVIIKENKDILHTIITYDDRDDDRSCLKGFIDFSKENNKSIVILKGPVGLKKIIKKEKPDFVIVVGWYWIIHESILNLVKGGFIGIHGSLLPKYRGFAPFVWSLINGEKKTGVSLFYLSEGIDTGDIIDQKEITLEINTTIKSLLEKAEKESINLIKDNFKKIIENKNNRIKQIDELASYCSKRTPEDGLINWQDSNVNIHNFIRAQTFPYPGAYCFYLKEKYFIIKSKILNDIFYGIPGLVVKKNANSIIVSCGTNAIEILDIRDELKKENIVTKFKFGDKFY